LPFQDPTKNTQIWIFGIKIIPSGNPDGTTTLFRALPGQSVLIAINANEFPVEMTGAALRDSQTQTGRPDYIDGGKYVDRKNLVDFERNFHLVSG
jgi:hypothetical protein